MAGGRGYSWWLRTSCFSSHGIGAGQFQYDQCCLPCVNSLQLKLGLVVKMVT